MRHNKFIGWDTFLGAVERLQKVSPWLSRQIAQRASEWPFWYSGLRINEWRDNQVQLHMPFNARNSVDGELCQGHVLLGGELALRLVLLRYRQEFPFRHRMVSSRLEVHHPLDQALDYRFAIEFTDWERIRLELARTSASQMEFVFPAYLADGRLAVTLGFTVAFQLEKFLPA